MVSIVDTSNHHASGPEIRLSPTGQAPSRSSTAPPESSAIIDGYNLQIRTTPVPAVDVEKPGPASLIDSYTQEGSQSALVSMFRPVFCASSQSETLLLLVPQVRNVLSFASKY